MTFLSCLHVGAGCWILDAGNGHGRRWIRFGPYEQCPQCHAEKSDHELRKTTEMHFICKKVSPAPSLLYIRLFLRLGLALRRDMLQIYEL